MLALIVLPYATKGGQVEPGPAAHLRAAARSWPWRPGQRRPSRLLAHRGQQPDAGRCPRAVAGHRRHGRRDAGACWSCSPSARAALTRHGRPRQPVATGADAPRAILPPSIRRPERSVTDQGGTRCETGRSVGRPDWRLEKARSRQPAATLCPGPRTDPASPGAHGGPGARHRAHDRARRDLPRRHAADGRPARGRRFGDDAAHGGSRARLPGAGRCAPARARPSPTRSWRCCVAAWAGPVAVAVTPEPWRP